MRLIEVPPSDDEEKPCATFWEEEKEDYPTDRKARKGSSTSKKYKKEKSLGILCQQFISLFVSWKPIISLEEAAKQISDDDENLDEQRLKTKIRRLYDIANVLQSIGLIHKTQKSECRKPAFSWIGIHSVKKAIDIMKVDVQNNLPAI